MRENVTRPAGAGRAPLSSVSDRERHGKKMNSWTAEQLLGSHLEHRQSILRAYRNRAEVKKHVAPEAYRNVYNALVDAAMVTCRSLREFLGVTVPSQNEKNTGSPAVGPEFKSWKKYLQRILSLGIEIVPFDEAQFAALREKREIVLVLVAANKCVAHLDAYPNHGVGAAEIEAVIDVTFREIAKLIRMKA